MKEKLKNDKYAKDLLFKFISVLVIASIALLLLNVMTQNKDGRTQIVDEDGGTEYLEGGNHAGATREELRLAEILSGIKGVGDVDVMITYENAEAVYSVFDNNAGNAAGKVKGVIVTASGADSSIVKNDITNAVAAVFDISVQNVIVFEKE